MPTRRTSCCSGRRSPNGRSPYGSAGFSIVELLIVAAVAVTLSAIGVAQLRAGVQQFRLQQGTSIVAGKLMDARLSALKRNRPTWLAIDVTTRTVRVQTNGGGGATVDLSPAAILPQGVTFAAAPAKIDYDALGRLAAVQTITLDSAGAGSRLVTVSVTGTTSVTNVASGG